ncbi:MAG: hypothetical protein ACRDA4_10560 [Filifactoraceae bacterium]
MENQKFEIKFKDKENKYNGEYGPCNFINGKTETSNPWFAAWFEGNGFEVKKLEVEVDTVEEKKSNKNKNK